MMRRRTIPALLAALPMATGITPALAHAHLLSATPAADAAGPSPDSLTLTFSEGLELKFTGVTVTGPDGSVAAAGPAQLAPREPTRLVVPVPGPLAPGRYRVDWHAVATDGHRTTGRYDFTVTP